MKTSSIADEELMAFADGELDNGRCEQIRRACEQDPRLAARVEMFRASRRLLTHAFEPVLQEPLPDRLLNAIDSLADDQAQPGAEAAGPLSVRATARRRRPRWIPALAASIAFVGSFAAVWLIRDARPGTGPAASVAVAGAPLAPVVQAALEHAVSGELVHGQIAGHAVDVLPRSTVQDGAVYCREFDVVETGGANASPQRGLACRDRSEWVPRSLPAAVPPASSADDGYQTASGGIEATRAIDHAMPVSADRERELIASGWLSR